MYDNHGDEMNREKTKQIVTGAFMAALFGVLSVVNVYTGTMFDIIFIYSVTTTMWLIDFLKNKSITILTNNLSAIVSALPYPNLNIISLGGTLKIHPTDYLEAKANVGGAIYYINRPKQVKISQNLGGKVEEVLSMEESSSQDSL